MGNAPQPHPIRPPPADASDTKHNTPLRGKLFFHYYFHLK